LEPKPEILPYFPLSVFLFPGEDIPLRIFEPRYRQLIEDARKTDITFAIPFVMDRKIREFGCEVRLKEIVAENPGGRMVIIVESIALVQIISYRKQLGRKLYAGGTVRRMSCSDPVESQELRGLVKHYINHFDKDFLSCCHQGEVTSQNVIKALNLPSEDKYRFICMTDSKQKEGYLTGQIRYLMMIRKQETLLGDDFGLN